jgi:hypothetical protein
MNKIVTSFISQFSNHKKDILLINADFSQRGANVTLFSLNEIPTKNKPVFFHDYFQNKDTKKYDLIIAELPFGLRSKKNKDFGFSVQENWEMVYRLLNNLKEKGVLLVGTEPSLGTSTKSKAFLGVLNDKGVFLNALIETPQKILAPLTALQPNIAIFSRQANTKTLFVASLDEADDQKVIFENYVSKKGGGNLIEGDIIDADSFKGFFNYRIGKKIEHLQTQYKEFEKKHFKDVAININSTRTTFEEKNGEYLYIPQIGNLNVHNALDQLDKKHQNFYQININGKIASSKYLKQYFKSDLGQLSLKALFANTFIPRINKSELEDLVIPLPPLVIQKEIISSYNLLDDVFNVINSLEKDLSLNPKNAKKIIEKLTDTLVALNELSKADKILYYVRQGENLTIEYKATFSKDIEHSGKVPAKEIENSALKTIAGFLNKKGGVLLIGVTDDSKILGIENDDYQTKDKYLLHFKNKVKVAIGEEHFDLINYEIVDVNGKKVLLVECKQSPSPVYMYGNDFYVRTNPATDKLEGPKLVKYIKNHFK